MTTALGLTARQLINGSSSSSAFKWVQIYQIADDGSEKGAGNVNFLSQTTRRYAITYYVTVSVRTPPTSPA